MPKSSFSNSRKVGRRHGISHVCLNKPNDANETTKITNNHHIPPTNSKQLPRGNRGSPIQGKRSATKLKARQGSPKMLRIQQNLAKRCQKSRKRLPNKQQATTNKRQTVPNMTDTFSKQGKPSKRTETVTKQDQPQAGSPKVVPRFAKSTPRPPRAQGAQLTQTRLPKGGARGPKVDKQNTLPRQPDTKQNRRTPVDN